MDTTATETQRGTATSARCWGLVLAHHPRLELVGRRVLVMDGHALEVGREARLLGEQLFDDKRISRRHASVVASADGVLTLIDHGARNGSRVNGERVGRATLAAGDLLGFGRVLLSVERVATHQPSAVAAAHGGTAWPSQAFGRLLHQLAPLDKTQVPLLLFGEPGTGKTRLARRLHEDSGRSGSLEAVSCGALPAERAVEMLLGCQRAGEVPVVGLMEAAAGGTLLLENVEHAPLSLQLALLSVLDRAEARRVGSTEAQRLDVRVIGTASMPPAELRARPDMNAGFVDRIARHAFELPPLKQRRADLGLLALQLVRRFAGPAARPHYKLIEHVCARDWPGQVRELEAFIERAVLSSPPGKVVSVPEPEPAVSERGARPAPDDDGVVLARDGSWFVGPDGARVDLSQRKALPRILAALITAHERDPAGALSVDELLAAGWVGERPRGDSGANRVYVALTTLRGLGLRDVLERNANGYRIAAGQLRRVDG